MGFDPATATTVVEPWSHEQRYLDQMADAAALDAACEGLARADPEASAKVLATPGQKHGAWALLGAFVVFVMLDAPALWTAMAAVATFVFGALIILRFAALIGFLGGRHGPETSAADTPLPVVSLLVPLHREANMVAQLAEAIARIDYPEDRLDVIFITEADDEATNAALRRDARLSDMIRILPAPPCAPRTKPKALNFALAFARGDIIGVLDAEDRPHPRQVRAAAAAFAHGPRSLAVVQAPLLTDNPHESWLAAHFHLEYANHSLIWLPFLARLHWPLMLGGTSNYFSARHLRKAGGWDPYNVTEDADLGLRLARFGFTARVIQPPTIEEGPVRARDWLTQRTRWIKGHLQTWLVLNRRPFETASGMGVWSYFGAQITLGGSLLAAALHGPLLVWLITAIAFRPDFIADWRAILLGAGYVSSAASALAAAGLRDRGWTLLSLPLYRPLLSIAFAIAVHDLLSRPHHWAKTPHRPQADRLANRSRS